MWTRKELKQNALARFKANYWICVLAGLIMLIVLGDAGGSNSRKNLDRKDVTNAAVWSNDDREFVQDPGEEINEIIDEFKDELSRDFSIPEKQQEDISSIVGPIVAGVLGVVVVVLLLGTALKIFVLCPFEVGGRRFFIANHDSDKPSLKEFCTAFSSEYLNVVLTMFLRNLFTFLWTLLFIIPGVIKSYEYRMIPYVLAENNGIEYSEAFAISKKMMDGNKWKAFVLDLSFIGWHILNGITFGILGVFFLNPYIYQTDAELYLKLKGFNDNTDSPERETFVSDNYIEVE